MAMARPALLHARELENDARAWYAFQAFVPNALPALAHLIHFTRRWIDEEDAEENAEQMSRAIESRSVDEVLRAIYDGTHLASFNAPADEARPIMALLNEMRPASDEPEFRVTPEVLAALERVEVWGGPHRLKCLPAFSLLR